MGVTDDGRLELDELGSVIDRASSLAPEPADDLLEGNDAPTWRERLESRGVTPWIRRHRVAIAAGTAVLVVAGVAGGAWLRSQPPAYDPTVEATVADALADGMVTETPGTVYDGFNVVAVHVEPRAGEAITVLGIEGPGIRASKAVPNPAATGESVDDVYIAPGCDDPRSYSATFDDYRLMVRRTDAFGRTGEGRLVLPSALAAQLAGAAAQSCFQTQVAESVSVLQTALVPDVAHRTVQVRLTLRNGLADDLVVQAVTSTLDMVEASGELSSVAAGATEGEAVTLTLNDCTSALGGAPTTPGGGTSNGRQADIVLFATPANGGDTGAEIPVVWDPRDRAVLTTALRQMCAAGPGATLRVLSASPAPLAVSQAYGFTGPNDGVVLRTRVEITSAGSHVVLSDATFPRSAVNVDGPRQVTTASTDLRGGRAVVTVDWAAQCNGVMNPPPVWLTATDGRTSYPYRGVLDELVLAKAYSAACPGTIPADLSGFGWPSG